MILKNWAVKGYQKDIKNHSTDKLISQMFTSNSDLFSGALSRDPLADTSPLGSATDRSGNSCRERSNKLYFGGDERIEGVPSVIQKAVLSWLGVRSVGLYAGG